uniref:Uncharacterized protein n=1 Tax=Glossina morsitans morsitans TaxID=37546 RepID=A0A1B0G4A1_GLOMM
MLINIPCDVIPSIFRIVDAPRPPTQRCLKLNLGVISGDCVVQADLSLAPDIGNEIAEIFPQSTSNQFVTSCWLSVFVAFR